MDVDRAPGGEYVVDAAERLEMDPRALAAVVAVTALALSARLLFLGARPMHFDEARVAYWGLNAVREGVWSYRPVVHGPLMQHFNRWLFPLFGTSDFVARLPVAVVGGLLPASALLLRERLEDLEVAALAALLAVNPLLLYYSRFMRSDVLVAAFAFVAFGALVRLYDTRRLGYLYAASGAMAFAFASKENAIVYVLCWGGMVGLVWGLEVLDPRRYDSRTALRDSVLDRLEAAVDRAMGWDGFVVAVHALGALALFALLTVFLFARRAPPGDGVGLWHSGPVVVVQYVIADVVCGLEFWMPLEKIGVPRFLLPDDLADQTCRGFGGDEGPLANYARDAGRQLQILGRTASGVAALALVGVVAEFRRERPRMLAPAAFYWGVASLVGYPVGADIIFPAWVTVHAVVPLTVPAAVGAVELAGWVREETTARNPVTATTLVIAVLLLTGSIAGTAVHHAYVEPTGDEWDREGGQMVQFAQPEHAMKASVDATRRAAGSNDGLDVLVYDTNTDQNGALVDMGGPGQDAVPCMRFIRGLPLSWYLYSFDGQVDCADNASRLDAALADDPPVVITREGSTRDVRQRLGDDYVSATYNYRRGSREVTFFFDTTRVDPPERATRGDESASGAE
jgi:predicted membrane-bound mannosyltransferase